jgi:diketogulonate reductase-like aldo/keto reductase
MFGRECTEHTLAALNAGYTYLDLAQLYKNSQYAAPALKQWGGKRQDVYILTKCTQCYNCMANRVVGSDPEIQQPSEPRKALLKELESVSV